jgi:hypothetical protein
MITQVERTERCSGISILDFHSKKTNEEYVKYEPQNCAHNYQDEHEGKWGISAFDLSDKDFDNPFFLFL